MLKRLPLLAILVFSLCAWNVHGRYQPPVILDDDLGDDIDNAADWRLFNNLTANGAIFAVAGVNTAGNYEDVQGVAAFRNYQSLKYPVYRATTSETGGYAWVEAVVAQFNPHDSDSNYLVCEEGYRLALANVANNSVTIVVGGGVYCLDLLLQSPANYSGDGLGTGLSIIEAKVKQVIWAAGSWPSGSGDPNMDQDTASTADLFANWPSTVPFYLYGVNLSSGVTGPFPSGICQTSATDRYQYGFYEYEPTGNPCTRTFWTQPCFLFATQGLGTNFSIAGANGSVTFNTGTTVYSWSSTPGPFSYMANVASQASLMSQVCTLERITGTNWC